MRLINFQKHGDDTVRPGVWTNDNGAIDISDTVADIKGHNSQSTMEAIIDNFDDLRPGLDKLLTVGDALPEGEYRLRPPLPRPGKMLCCIGNYWEHMEREPKPLNMFLKNPDAVIGPGDTIILPEFDEPDVFHHEAELAIVIKGPAKMVKEADWQSAVFGYTAMIDVSARAEARFTWRRGSWMGKSFDTFGPLGPCILTADEVPDPNNLHVRLWCSGELRHDYNTNDMEHRVPEMIEWASTLMTLHSGNTIACGTNHEGLGALQDGDVAEIEIADMGKMTVNVTDPLKRQWERGVYLGEASTNPEAVAKARAELARQAQEKQN